MQSHQRETDTSTNLQDYLCGDKLYGDDFVGDALREWFRDEERGYEGLVKATSYEYPYATMDKWYCYKHISRPPVGIKYRALGLGSAFGHEFLPIRDWLGSITIIEASSYFAQQPGLDLPVEYLKASPLGDIEFSDEQFDLITCFSALHHIANVSHVISELVRVLRPGGMLFIREPILSMREPIYSMADWERPRKGLTKRERGIPLKFFRQLWPQIGTEILSERVCGLPTTRKLTVFGLRNPYDSRIALYWDRISSFFLQCNTAYHSYSRWNRMRPSIVIYALRRKS